MSNMTDKTYIPEGEVAPLSQVGATLEALAATIAARWDAGEESYTHQLLTGELDKPLKKVAEEAVEVGLAAKDVEAWATSSIAATLAVDACVARGDEGGESGEGREEAPPCSSSASDASGARVGVSGVAPAGASSALSASDALGANSVSVTLPAEYGAAIDHLRYEAADVVYHLLVVLERFGISLDEFAAELNNRMTEEERPEGAIRLFDEYVRRGK